MIDENPNYDIILSSTLFLLPTFYSFYKKKYILTTVSLLTTFCSINYWRNPTIGMRFVLDKIVSKTGGIIYFLYGYNNTTCIGVRIFSFTNGCMILSLYNASCLLYFLESSYWKQYHVAFHVASVIGKLLILL